MAKAFLMAAGLGTRLRPLTDKIPKCLLPIGSKPLLQIWLELLCRHGVDQVLVNTHWLHEKVAQFLGNWENAELKAMSSYEPVLLGSAGTILKNREWVSDGEPFFILYGDNLTNIDLSEIYAYHCLHGQPFTLGVFRTENPRECGIAEVGENGLVTGFVEKPENPVSDLAAAGVYVADSRIFDFFPAGTFSGTPLDLGFHIIPKLLGRMKAYYINDFLMDIGTPKSYENANKLWKNRSAPWKTCHTVISNNSRVSSIPSPMVNSTA